MNVLMAYATKNGSTQQVADAVAVALREHSAQVTLLPARAAGESVTGYDLSCSARPCTPDAGIAMPTGSSGATAGGFRGVRGPVRAVGAHRDRGGPGERSRPPFPGALPRGTCLNRLRLPFSGG